MTKEELVQDIEKLEKEIGECEECGDFASIPYLESILVAQQKKLKEYNNDN